MLPGYAATDRPDESFWTVYILQDPRTGKAFYVGSTASMKSRLAYHFSKGVCSATIKEIVREGMLPVVWLKHFPPGGELDARQEERRIAGKLRKTHPLLNKQMNTECSTRATTEDMREFSTNLRTFREQRGWSVSDLAEAAKCSRVSVYKFEDGSRQPAWRMVQRLADALGVSTDDLRNK